MGKRLPGRRPCATAKSIELPTLAVAVAIYGGFGLVTWFHRDLPWWVLLPAGAYLVAWHGSLQHEVVHGHPTPWSWLNEALVLPSLWLWLPFRRYQDSHLLHHNDEALTDPLADPESYYLSAECWAGMARPLRILFKLRNTLAGRLVLGPAFACAGYLSQEFAYWRRYSRGSERVSAPQRKQLAALGLHLAGCALTLTWVLGVCGMSFWTYLLFFAYAGTSLTLLRSFLEHRAHANPAARTAIVEGEWPLALLFLNNNLHVVHHEAPGLAWYELPARYRRDKARILAANGGYLVEGYGQVFRRYFLRCKEHPCLERALAQPGR